MSAFVSPARPVSAALTPSVSIAIAVDTAAIAAVQDGKITSGVYMMDNQVRNGSGHEGRIDLHTVCNVGALIGFQVLPINAAGTSGDSATLTSFALQGGDDVFTGAGHPRAEPPPKGLAPGSYWIGQAMAAGTEEYQIQIEVTVGALQPTSFYVTWEATLTAS
ncbi:hypothetical protein MHM88_02945 [Epibacterium sp. MM17-32]|uniref:hypothetical protein n=1 Tax=Epibacterium sp. MM17-32 TaxID=2917734 RepID=UPI001EF5BCCD|nr:hypothetical protein [Epibacterium sp. MM17-32]MCG7626745.1 hypothetical protein [Epibacterium sp. MM17-32]